MVTSDGDRMRRKPSDQIAKNARRDTHNCKILLSEDDDTLRKTANKMETRTGNVYQKFSVVLVSLMHCSSPSFHGPQNM